MVRNEIIPLQTLPFVISLVGDIHEKENLSNWSEGISTQIKWTLTQIEIFPTLIFQVEIVKCLFYSHDYYSPKGFHCLGVSPVRFRSSIRTISQEGQYMVYIPWWDSYIIIVYIDPLPYIRRGHGLWLRCFNWHTKLGSRTGFFLLKHSVTSFLFLIF